MFPQIWSSDFPYEEKSGHKFVVVTTFVYSFIKEQFITLAVFLGKAIWFIVSTRDQKILQKKARKRIQGIIAED